MKGYLKENLNKEGKTISFRIGAPTGKDELGKYQYTFETVKTDSIGVARKRLRALLTEVDNGTFIKPGKASLSEYLKVWLVDYVKSNLSPRTHELYSYICDKHLIPLIGNIPLSQLKPAHLQHLYADKLESGLSNRTVQLIHITLHKALKNAVKTGLILRNPADSIDIPKAKRHEMKVMSEVDLRVFLTAAKKTEYYPLFFTALYTGMRRGELLALRWQDIDLMLCQISVTRSMQYLDKAKIGEKITFKETKTAKSRRAIALSPANAIVLREHLEARKKFLKSLDPKFDPEKDFNQSDLVFCQWDSKPYTPNGITHAWLKLTRLCGLNGIRLHDARHTHASLLLKQGVHPKIVQERLGHAGIAITLDLYSHVAPGMQAAAAVQFDAIAAPKETKLDKELNQLLK